jgi:hypothetical protein
MYFNPKAIAISEIKEIRSKIREATTSSFSKPLVYVHKPGSEWDDQIKSGFP